MKKGLQASKRASRLMRTNREEAPASHRWLILRDDSRVLRVVDPIASMEALQTLKKKQCEEERCDSNGARLHRCPSKGAGYHKGGVRRSRTFDTVSPILFTIPNFLTLEDCERFITASESWGFRHRTSYSMCDGRTNTFCDNLNFNESNQMWTPGLKAVFESIRVEGNEDAFAIGVSPKSIFTYLYEKGERCEPQSNDMLYRHDSWISSDFYTLHGYSVLVYLNGSQAEANSHAGSPRDVVGGETVFYSRQHLNGNSKKQIAKIALEAGMAVCIARGQRSPVHEIRPVANGVLFMAELNVQFSNFRGGRCTIHVYEVCVLKGAAINCE